MFDKMWEIEEFSSDGFGFSYSTSLIASDSEDKDNARNGKFVLEVKSDG